MSDIVIKQGVNNKYRWTVKDTITKQPIDLRTGYSLKGQIRPLTGSAVLLFEWDSSKSTATLVGETVFENGALELRMTAAQSLVIDDDYARCVYQVLLTRTSDGDASEVDRGSVTFDKSVVQ